MIKIRKVLLIMLICVCVLTGCSNSTQNKTEKNETSQENVKSQDTIVSTSETTSEVIETTVSTLETTSEVIETTVSTSDTIGNTDNKDGTYGEIFDDVELLTKAIKSDDSSILTDERDIFVFNEVNRIINENLTDNMSVYEKELVIHDYMVRNTKYDPDELNWFKKANPESVNPYGLLKNGRAICLGYTKTFQLFMNVLDIPCIIIHSETTEGEEHAWNMVMIENEWYHVDVTWDDPVPDIGKRVTHSFFNVTDLVMEKQHVWDKDIFPSATSEDYKYKK